METIANYWSEEEFKVTMEKVRRFIVKLLANTTSDFEAQPNEIGRILQVFEILAEDDEKQ